MWPHFHPLPPVPLVELDPDGSFDSLATHGTLPEGRGTLSAADQVPTGQEHDGHLLHAAHLADRLLS